ncbi:SpoIIE family protein phosphatase [Microbacterium sp. zg.Y1090]|uniref:PP2C family protein-serine/threonine phosphatase n=1 Tax=Microbacterium TaxID=33882 RepID=UPI00214C8C35|nr:MULTISPECIES: SpoIIE family protein phosphatase [unclassified Microbacterium]MCR2811458.1 SpoIIE family protein phosphatase [Microbacterium sp. zg.Y1084]MCR2819123.1 SpoIIE family protein phosphatase [Microbacterium sp. zg.Y1090]MDL5487878.1 SpoIIE family protein phosphatase [Microbacterium sp. zg-Y1211]WIM27425.1 SpoIIE family protein phosphatase [Microbacterium sp. zg-Y1090]
MPARLRAAAVSDVGEFRTVNQDAAFAASWGAGVADGVGGGPAGDLASAALLHRLVVGAGPMRDAEQLAERVRWANWDIGAHARRDPALVGMATTFTGLWLSEAGSLLLAHTGDSRAYLWRDGALSRQTRDDSLVQALVDQGILSAEEAAVDPRRNIITASLGGGEEDVISVAELEPVAGDRWLLCSDGVSDYVPFDELARLLELAPTPERAAEWVVRVALDAGTRDNATAVVCDVSTAPSGTVADASVRFAGAATARFAEGLESA